MIKYARQPRVSIFLLAMTLLWGCAVKQRPVAPAPPEAPHTATPEPTPSPSPAPSETQTEHEAQAPGQGTPPPEPEQTPATANAEKKTKVAKQHAAPKKSPSPTPAQTAKSNPPRKVVPHEPEPVSGQISPAGDVVGHGEPSTEQLLQNTENGLNNLKRQLSADEQATVTQIREFVNQSRQATKDNDAMRAHNLAVKAHLMCDDLLNRK
jgi:cytoskeletal protein RodZ